MYVIHLGISGFPQGNAPIQRIRLTFKALKLGGFIPLIINKYSLNTVQNKKRLRVFDGIPYIALSHNTSRPDNFVIRLINKVSGNFNELVFILRKKKKIKAGILYTPSFFELVYYRILSKLSGFKLIIQYVELRSAIPERQHSFINKINDALFDGYCHLFCDGVIAISEFLKSHIEQKASRKKVIKIPALCDFNEFPTRSTTNDKAEQYIMYCGTINYLEIIEFILNVFNELKHTNRYYGKLLLVVSGNDKGKWTVLKELLSQHKYGDLINVKTNIPYDYLLDRYVNSDILAIPLRNTTQDIARFPHKIGEYTASGRAILTTKLGEPAYYFDDSSALLADELTIEAYADKVAQAVANDNIDLIGQNGNLIGKKNFHYETLAPTLYTFINNLSDR